MKVLKILEDAEIVLADIEVHLGKKIQHAPTLCVRYKGKIIPLNTPDMRPILMKEENAIDIDQVYKAVKISRVCNLISLKEVAFSECMLISRDR